jgi:hypothetical protein
MVFAAARNFTHPQLSKPYSLTAIPNQMGAQIIDGDVIWHMGAHLTSPLDTARMVDDPVDQAVAVGVVSLRKRPGSDVRRESDVAVADEATFDVIVSKGPLKDQALPGQRGGLRQYIIRPKRLPITWQRRAWNVNGAGWTELPHEMFRSVTLLLRQEHDHRIFQSEFPARLVSLLTAIGDHTVDVYGPIAQLCAAVAAWRRSSRVGWSSVVRTTDMSGAVTLSAMAEFIGAWIKSDLHALMPRATSISLALARELLRVASQFKETLRELDDRSGVYVLDETLRRLAGFMQVQGVPHAWPKHVRRAGTPFENEYEALLKGPA